MDPLEGVGNRELRATLLWARTRDAPVTADELATEHGLHRNVARSRLERLAAAGLLRAAYERRSGRRGPGAGRPAKVYAVAPQVEPIEFPPRHHESLVGLLLDALPAEAHAAVGAAFGRRLAEAAGLRPAATVRTGVERLCAALRRLGYQVSVVDADERRAILATPTCPLRPLVRTRPAASLLDRAMWSGFAEVALPRAEAIAVCEDCHDDNASCRVTLELTPRVFSKT
jgi:predicted ArsR family transcriptional regulator